jgi:hypothetical protein
MAGVIRIRLEDTVCGGIVAGCIHGIGACLVEGSWESHIASVPAGDGDFRHDAVVSPVLLMLQID